MFSETKSTGSLNVRMPVGAFDYFRMAARCCAGARKVNPAPPSSARFQKISSSDASNGLKLYPQDHSIPLVTIELAVKNGSYTEPGRWAFTPDTCSSNRMRCRERRRLLAVYRSDGNCPQRQHAKKSLTTTTTTSPNIRTAMQFYERCCFRYHCSRKTSSHMSAR